MMFDDVISSVMQQSEMSTGSATVARLLHNTSSQSGLQNAHFIHLQPRALNLRHPGTSGFLIWVSVTS